MAGKLADHHLGSTQVGELLSPRPAPLVCKKCNRLIEAGTYRIWYRRNPYHPACAAKKFER